MNLKRDKGAYSSWSMMIQRCTNPNRSDYPSYGGKGISVCMRWREFIYFHEDMGDRPPGYTLDRIDNELGYFAENCRWATRKQQSDNSSNPVYLTHNGITKNIKDWARELNVTAEMLYMRRHRKQDIFRGLP